MSLQGALVNLTDMQFAGFMDVYNKHFKTFETPERREQHSLENIVKVDWVPTEKLFRVYYKETDVFASVCYHYNPNDLTWWLI